MWLYNNKISETTKKNFKKSINNFFHDYLFITTKKFKIYLSKNSNFSSNNFSLIVVFIFQFRVYNPSPSEVSNKIWNDFISQGICLYWNENIFTSKWYWFHKIKYPFTWAGLKIGMVSVIINSRLALFCLEFFLFFAMSCLRTGTWPKGIHRYHTLVPVF